MYNCHGYAGVEHGDGDGNGDDDGDGDWEHDDGDGDGGVLAGDGEWYQSSIYNCHACRC